MKQLEKLIGPALEAVEKHLTKERKDAVAKEYDGYAASFGAALRTSGLLPTLAFYSDYHKEKNKPRRNHLLQALYEVVKLTNEKVALSNASRLLEVAVQLSASEQKQLERDLLNASIAVKLALRNFEPLD
ncbi:MAG TPA: hypothetical protein DCF33_05760 [Saprospirales bacterium]|nr:hypothetical protein [Saprospirales bacterium]